ncbi:hypothetical protein YPPY42_4068, partial [Yersinia pestis PY-42]
MTGKPLSFIKSVV